MKQTKLGILFIILCLHSLLIFPPGFADAAGQDTWQWTRAVPEEQDLDSKRLDKLITLLRAGKAFPRIDSILIVRRGKLVVEEYFRGFSAERLHTLQSVSKSFTSALIGIALSKGELSGVEKKILDFFPDVKKDDPLRNEIRIMDLLTMRSGTDYHERGPGSPHFQLNALETGWDDFYLQREMLRKPGTHFLYDSGGVILLSSILKARTGKHADEYARGNLFDPLEINPVFWFKNREGHPHTGGGLHLRPMDMAKFGWLYLCDGQWEGRQVIPKAWIKDSLRQWVTFPSARGHTIGYGYLWWILEPDPDGSGSDPIYAAMGFRAQYIFLIPEHEMVVVVTGDTQNGIDQNKPIQFLYSHILPAVIEPGIREEISTER